MRLSRLIAAARMTDPVLQIHGKTEVDVTTVILDSRQAIPGALFAALPGVKVDGRSFIPKAVAAGAQVLLVPTDTPINTLPKNLTVLLSAAPRRVLAHIAAAFHTNKPKTMVAITGTNGKTSVAEFTRQIWQANGCEAASLGTLGVISDKGHIRGNLTTPDVVSLHAGLETLAERGITHVALEASSHGLDQMRLDALNLTAAAFTNLSRDHLDYHKTLDAYFEAKARLFHTVLPEGAAAVINADIPEATALREMARKHHLRIVDYGEAAQCLRLNSRLATPQGQDLHLTLYGKMVNISLPLAGKFQAMNALAALGLALASGVEQGAAVTALSNLKGAPGRMECRAMSPDEAAVYVDYAHTPDALETVLKALRPHTQGKLIVVFGCGGDRDRGKRPLMGSIANALADKVYVTDDNPRSENAAAIRSEICVAAPNAIEIGDRSDAIHTAMRSLDAGDVLVVAGKGHETGQLIDGIIHPFDDRLLVDTLARELWQS